MLPPCARESCRAAAGTASRGTAPALKTTMYDPGIASSAARTWPAAAGTTAARHTSSARRRGLLITCLLRRGTGRPRDDKRNVRQSPHLGPPAAGSGTAVCVIRGVRTDHPLTGGVMTRRRVRASFAFLVCVAAIAAVSASASSGGSPGLAALRICGSGARPASGYRYVVLQAWQYGQIAAIKKHSPGTQVLVYKDMASTRDDTARQSDLSTGVSYAYADRHHPEWFLKDTGGRRVNWASWPHSWQMDVGSRSYHRAWARNVARELRGRGWDGVFLDGISRTMQYPWYLNGRVLAKYPGANDYARATTKFLRRVGPALRRRHLVVGNINDATLPLWRRWVGYTSGASKEWWTKSSAGRDAGILSGADWAFQMRLLR